MKLTLQLQIIPDEVQKVKALQTVEAFRLATNYVARCGFDVKAFSQPDLHRIVYHDIRKKFGLSAQLAVRAIAKVVDCFRRSKKTCPVFKAGSAVCYDQRILSFLGEASVSIWLIGGRQTIPFVCGAYQKALLGRIKGQADLIYRQGKFFLLCTFDIDQSTEIEPRSVLGVDLGVVNIATDSTGQIYSGKAIEDKRKRVAYERASLASCGSKSAKRKLCRKRRSEANFRRNANHVIAKQIVAKAKASDSTIAIENLNGIRSRLTVSPSQRSRLGSWGFAQLRAFIEYKAAIAGIPVIVVNPANTSRTCSACGHCEKKNRKSQNTFKCIACGFTTNADFNAALNVRAKGIVNCPIVGLA